MNQWCIELRLLLHIFFWHALQSLASIMKKKTTATHCQEKNSSKLSSLKTRKMCACRWGRVEVVHSFFISENIAKFVQWKQRKKPKKLIFFSFYFKTIKSMNNFLMTWDSEFNELELWLCQMFDQMNFSVCVCQMSTFEFIYKTILDICSEFHCLIVFHLEAESALCSLSCWLSYQKWN